MFVLKNILTLILCKIYRIITVKMFSKYQLISKLRASIPFHLEKFKRMKMKFFLILGSPNFPPQQFIDEICSLELPERSN